MGCSSSDVRMFVDESKINKMIPSKKPPLEKTEKSKSFYDALCNGKSIILVSLEKRDSLILSIVNRTDLEYKIENVNIVSYRWKDNATAFKKQFDWRAALKRLICDRETIIPSPKETHASRFYQDIIKIFDRIGTKYLWIDQLSIPQDHDLTMKIVEVSGSL